MQGGQKHGQNRGGGGERGGGNGLQRRGPVGLSHPSSRPSPPLGEKEERRRYGQLLTGRFLRSGLVFAGGGSDVEGHQFETAIGCFAIGTSDIIAGRKG